MSLNDNFRRDLLGRVFELSQLPAIDSNVESLSNVKTFNDRFRNLQNSLLYSFRAMADIAFRDKKYLQEFFKGYANPIYTKTYAHVLKDAFKVTNYFNTNGVPVTFTEDMIFYDCDDYGNLETNDTYVYVFKNGLWLTEDKYYLYNTAYGLKAYVKSAEVADNDEISIVINKKYKSALDLSLLPYTETEMGLITYDNLDANDLIVIGKMMGRYETMNRVMRRPLRQIIAHIIWPSYEL